MNITWRQTWPDRPDDGVGVSNDLEGVRARVYKDAGGKWYWFVNDTHSIGRGICESKDAAKGEVQALFERLRAERSRSG